MTALQIEKIRENVKVLQSDMFKYHGEEAMKHIEDADTEVCAMRKTMDDYIIIESIRKILARAKVEIEELIYPSNTDMEAAILRNEGSDLRVEVR
jgi:hypothetical protein